MVTFYFWLEAKQRISMFSVETKTQFVVGMAIVGLFSGTVFEEYDNAFTCSNVVFVFVLVSGITITDY